MQILGDVHGNAALPDVALVSDWGDSVRFADWRGRPAVLFFYPQADTDGCTIETLEFDAALPEFEAAGVALAGISPDPPEVLARFREKYGLHVTLLSDGGHWVIGPLGLWREKTTFGRTYIGLVRTTVLVSAEGRVARTWTVTRIKGHAAAVLAAVRKV